MVTLLNLEYRYFQNTRNQNDQTVLCVCGCVYTYITLSSLVFAVGFTA